MKSQNSNANQTTKSIKLQNKHNMNTLRYKQVVIVDRNAGLIDCRYYRDLIAMRFHDMNNMT